MESLFVHGTGDWGQPYLDFINAPFIAFKSFWRNIKKRSSKFFVVEGLLFMRGFNQAPLRYIAGNDVTRVLKEVYFEDYGEHLQAPSSLNRLFILVTITLS